MGICSSPLYFTNMGLSLAINSAKRDSVKIKVKIIFDCPNDVTTTSFDNYDTQFRHSRRQGFGDASLSNLFWAFSACGPVVRIRPLESKCRSLEFKCRSLKSKCRLLESKCRPLDSKCRYIGLDHFERLQACRRQLQKQLICCAWRGSRSVASA